PPGATPPGGRSLDQFGNGVQAHGWYNMTAVRAVSQASPGDLDRIEVATPAVPGGKYRLPSGAKVRPIALNFSDWIALGSQSQAVDQAWEVMKYLLEPEPLLAYCESRYFQPPRKSVADKGFMKQSHLQKMVQIFEKFGHAQIRVPDQAVFSKTLRDMGTDVFSGKVSPQAGIEEAARILQNDIDKADFKTTL
ncbi:MAG: hypothetical protein ACRDI2_11765, partial [Chloroflexota bacterium]